MSGLEAPSDGSLSKIFCLRLVSWEHRIMMKTQSGSLKSFFLLLLEVPSSHLKMDSRMCSAQKCAFWQRGAEPTTCKALSVSFERPLSPSWTSPQLTTSAFLESSSLCHVLCKCHNKAGVGTNVDIRSSNSFLVQRICLHSDTYRQSHWKGSCDHTADSFSQSPMLSATRSPKQASEGAQNQTPE